VSDSAVPRRVAATVSYSLPPTYTYSPPPISNQPSTPTYPTPLPRPASCTLLTIACLFPLPSLPFRLLPFPPFLFPSIYLSERRERERERVRREREEWMREGVHDCLTAVVEQCTHTHYSVSQNTHTTHSTSTTTTTSTCRIPAPHTPPSPRLSNHDRASDVTPPARLGSDRWDAVCVWRCDHRALL
jgi:hypothetical protein